MRQRKTKDGCKRVRGEEKLKKEVRKIKRRKKEEDMIREEMRGKESRDLTFGHFDEKKKKTLPG